MAEDKTYKPNLTLNIDKDGRVTLDDAFARRLAEEEQKEEKRRESIRARAMERAAARSEDVEPLTPQAAPRYEGSDVQRAVEGAAQNRVQNATEKKTDIVSAPDATRVNHTDVEEAVPKDRTTMLAGKMGERIRLKMHGDAEKWDREHPYKPETIIIGNQSAPDFAQVRERARGYYAHLTPDAANQYIQDVLHDSDFVAEVMDGAKEAGISEADYVRERLAPQIQQQVYEQLVEEHAPQSTLEYVMSGAMNSMIGQIFEASILPVEERNLRQAGREKYAADAGELAKLGNMAAGVVSDLPVFMVLGGTSGMLTKGLGMTATRNSTMQVASHLMREMATFGQYDALSSGVGQWYREGETDWRKVAAAAGKGTLSGAMMGVFGIGNNMLSRAYVSKYGFGPTWKYTFRGAPREIRSEEVGKWATDMAGRSAVLSVSSVLGQRMENPDFKWEDVNWGDEFKHALLLNTMLDLQGRVTGARRQQDGFEGGKLNADDIEDLKRAGMPVTTERQAYDYVVQTGRMGVLADRRLSMDQKQKMVDLLRLQDKEGKPLVLQVNPSTEARIGRTLDERWAVDEYDALGTLNMRRTFDTKEQAEAFAEKNSVWIDANKRAMLEATAESRRQTMANVESIRVVAEDNKCQPVEVASAVSKAMRGESLTKREKYLSDEVNAYADAYLKNVASLSETVAEETAGRYGHDPEWIEEAKRKDVADRSDDERAALRDYDVQLDEELNKRASAEETNGAVQGQEALDAGRTLYSEGDTESQRMQVIRTSVARERLVSVAGEEFARNLDEKGEAALYDYLYIPDEYMPLVDDYMRQKRTTEGMEDAMSERMKPAMDAAREIVGEMSPTTGADGQQEVQLVRDGEKTYVVRRQVGDVLMVTPISVNKDGTIDWSQYDGEVTRALKWKPQFSFERMNGEDIVREMVPEYTMERERIFGAPTEEEVLAVEAEGMREGRRPLLGEGSAIITPSSDTATEPVTSRDALQGGGQSGSASGQSKRLSEGKGTENNPNAQGNAQENSERANLSAQLAEDGREGMIGRSLSEEEADSTIRLMQERATEAPDIELTPENWLNEFGEDGKIETPIGEVKMGENQYFKLARKGREGKLGMIKPTLTSPDFIIEDKRPANGGSSERDTSFVFVKTFTRRDGERYYHFTSVTVSKDGQEVVISNQERSTNRISKLLREGKVAWIDSAFSLHPMAQIEEPIPLNDSSRPTNIDNQPTRLGISSSERFEGKGTENNPNAQGKVQENSERANLSAQWTEDGRLSDGNGGSVWAPKEQTVEKLTEDMGGDRTAALRVVRNKSKQLRRELEDSNKRLDEITDAKEYKAEWDRNLQLRESIEYWQEVDNSITDIQREAEMPEASRKMRSLMQQFSEALDVPLNVTDDMLYEMRRADKIHGNEYTEEDARNTNGFYTKDGGIVLNSRTVRGLSWAFGHETGHELKQRDAAAYQRWKDAILGTMDSSQLREEINAKRNNERYKGNTEEELTDEIANDQIGEIMADPKKLESFVRQLNPNTLEHLWETTKKWLKGMDDVSFDDVLESAKKAGGKVLDDIRERVDVWRGFKEQLTETERILAEAYNSLTPTASPLTPLRGEGKEKGGDLAFSSESERKSFDEVYDQFKGKANDAVTFLLQKKSGRAIGALHHKDVGDIDLWYGNDNAGLKKIAEKHPEVVNDLQGLLENMHVATASDNRIILENDTHKAVVSKMLGQEKTGNWLLSAYEKKGISASSSDIETEPGGKQNGTAPLQNSLSEGKGTENISDVQGKGTEYSSEVTFEKKNSVLGNTTDTDETSARGKQNDTATLQNTVSTGISGGSIDIVPEPEGKQNGTAPLQNPRFEGKDTANISDVQGKRTENAIQGLEGYSESDVKDMIRSDVERKLEDAGLDVKIKDIALHGSRMRGDARNDSDLDAVVEYEGRASEDGLFNILNEEPLEIEGIKVDINPITRGKSGTMEQYMKRSRAYDEEVISMRNEAEASGEGVKYSAETDPETLRRLENEETTTAYRAIRVDENGVYHSPMAGGGVGGAKKEDRTDTYKPKDGEWEKADEHPELATYNEGDEYAHITIDKGEGNGTLQVAYNPYIHTSRQMLNDQFTSAWRRPDLQVLKVEVPVSELTSGYRAQYAKNAVGETEWNEGVVAKQLPEDKKRRVILTRWDKPVGIVPVEEYARAVKEQLEGTDVEGIPFNCVTPAQREALVKEGVKILEPEKKAGTKAHEAYEEWLQKNANDISFSSEISINKEKTSDDDLPIGKKFVSLQSERDREAVSGQRERFAPTAAWREGVDDVTVHTTLGTMRKKYGELHDRAKAGDVEAALELVAAVVKPEKVKALAEAHPDARVAFVHAEEATGRNKIPYQYAHQFEKNGLTLAPIFQINKPAHTGSDRVGRFFRRARFDGEVEAGREYILVDDHVTMGGTLRDLKDYIESKGGKVVAVSTLTASAGSTKLRPTEEQIRQLNEKGITNEQLREAGIANSFDGLTRSEAREILVLADAGGDRGTPRGSKASNGLDKETRPEDGLTSKQSSERIAPEEGEHFLDYAQRVAHIRRLAVDTNPSEAQKEAGNYKKGHLKVDGYNITIENPRGTTRSGKDADGKEWSVHMNYDYGYIRGTEGVDGDHIDVYLSEKPEEGNVYVVDQIDQKTGKFDEHKVMYGFPSEDAAREAYLSQYEDGWKIGPVTEVSREQFKKWVESSHRKTKPFSEYKSLKASPLTPLRGEGENEDVRFSAEMRSRDAVPKVRGGWTERKILNYLKKNPTRSGVRSASRAIAEFESPEELKEHMFYHGTAWGSDKLKPSITMRDRDVERYGGGGYGEKYWGISLTKDKKIASRFSGTSSNVRIYPVVLLKDAKVVERPDFTDARDAEEHIAELWNDGVDAVWIGEGKEGKGEQELLVLNPRAVVNIGSPDFYRQYHLGLEDNPIRIADDAAIGNMYEMAKRFAAMKRPMRPLRPSKFETMPDGRLEWKNAEQYARETAEWQQRMKEWEESDEVKAYNEAEMEANRHVRFSAEHSGRQGTWKYLRKESLTRDNVPYFLYGMAGRYMEIMPKDGWGNKMLYRFEERNKEGKPHLNVLKAKEEANEVRPVLTQWRDELRAILGSDKATESAKTLLQSTVYDLDYALNWYDRVEAGDEKFYRTMDFPRFSAERDSRSAEDIARRDKEYAEAVAAGDKEKVDAMLREEAVAKGYNASSDYQGSIAFNGAAPSRNGYFETRDERKKAFDEGDFEGEYSLGDFAKVGLDNNDLGWQLTHPAAASAGHRPTLESIRNLNNAIKSKDGKIRMYRAVDAKVKENSFRNGDWVTPSREYAESHIQLQDWKKGRIIEQDVSIDDIWWNGDDINEWGYDDGRGTVYKNTANNRKLLEATYDDNGKLIPLSKRFNSRKADVRFSAEAPTFYSNAQRAVEGIRQEKATPEQWLAMIQKNGGLKAGEDKWLGLSDWLKSQKKSLSKQEVMDFIRENQIQIKEVKYAEDVDNSFDDEILEIWREAKGNNYDKADEVNRRLKEKYGDDFGKAAEVWYDGSLRVYNQTLLAKIKNGPDADTMPIEETRLNYTTKGLKNNREIALTVPTIESWNEHDEIHFGDAGEGRAVAWIRFGETKTKDPIVKEQARAALNAFNKYMSDMMDKYKLDVWNQDALSDVEKSEFQRLYKAMKDAERNYDNSWERVLVIDEIQSKRHQDGREKGYKVSIERAEAEMEAFLKRMRDKYNYKPKDKWSEIFNEKEIEELDRLNGQLNDAYFDHGRVPDAPFEKNWHELAMKRMLRLAAEEGYDKLAWTTGNQQAERYNIGDKLSQLTICRNKHNPDQYAIIGYDVYGHTENNKVIEKDCTRDELADYIGKDLARQAIESTEYEDRNSDWDVLNITGEDLRLGGEGMKGFYDQMLPRFMDKYGKKWGVKTKNIELPEVEDAGRKMWAVDITPEMRESVMEGQPMFSAEGPTYYSNAQRAVEGIRQEKATPDQWRAMIEKAGGMKIGEDKWTGLSEWLKSSDKKSLTKQEVMDFIRENSIQVEEEWYADNNVEQNPRLRELRNEFDEIRLEMEGSRSTLEVELDDFTTKMYEKYGYGWHDKLNEEELAYEERFEELSSTEGTTDEKAFREMVDRYGDDFSEAFSVDLNGRLEPVMNWGGEISDAARYYLDISEKPINDTRLEYTTEGLKNKREVALTVPTIEPWNESDEIHFGDAGDGRAVAWVRFGETTDKEDNRVLVIDEIQSKRHQEGREKGYRGRVNLSPATMDDLEIDRSGDLVAVKYKPVNERFMFTHDKSDAEILQAINETIDGGLMAEHLPRIPDAPFDKNWHELAMKRMLRLAAEEGYDKLAWTTGMQQAARYDIGQVIDQVSRSQTFGDTGETRFDLMPKDNSGGISLFVKDGKVTRSAQEEFEGKQLTDVVGKELAQKMLEMEDYSSLDIADMNLGGEGMRGFYDQMLPRFMDKYGKKWGVKVYDQEYQLPDDGHVENGKMVYTTNYTWHTVDVTPEMRESVMEGQPMFSAEAEKEYRRLRDIVEKPYRIEKLRNSKPVEITYTNEYPLERKSAKKWLKENIKGEYVNVDTGTKIGVSNFGIDKVTSHGEREYAHLKSLAAIPDMIRQSIYIGEVGNEKGNNKYESYQYYVCGLKIDGDDYTAKIVVGVKNGERYYDHELTQIEKGSLIDSLNEIAKPVAEKSEPVSGFTTAGDAPLPPYSAGKDKRLFSILQTNPEEIAEARVRMREMEAEMSERGNHSGQEDVQFSAEGTSPEWKKAAQELKRDADAMRRLRDLEQRDINEVAAGVLSRGGLLWADEGEGQYRKKGVKAMMGWSDGERRKFLGMFKTAENGGISVAEAGEAVEQACRDAGIRYDEEDPMAGVNAIQEVLGSVGSMSELTNYVERRRIDEAYSIAEENQAQEHDARDQWYREHYGMTYDEYEDWQESHASDGVVEKETESAKAQIDWLKRRNENQARQLERLQNKLDELKSMELGRPLVLAQDRIISSQQQEISAAKTEINRLKDEARYKKNYEKAYRELRDVKRQLAAYVRERMAAEDMPFTSKRELSKLLSTIEHTNTLEQMEEAITEVKIVSNRSRVHHLNYRLDRLMQMKVQGLNGRRMSVAKTVDDRTRRIIEDIRGRIEDLGITGMEEELDNLYRERRQTRTAINDAQKKGQTGEAETLETHWRELTEKIREKEDEIAQRRQESHGKGKLDIEDEISALEERYAQYAAGEKGVTWTDADADKITALFGMKVIEESKDNAHDVENIERSIRDKWNLLYQLREKRKDENLTGDEQRSIAGEMSRLKTEIDSERGLLADALSAEAESVERSINMMEELMDDGRNNLKKRVDAQLLHKMEVMKGAFSDVRKDGSEPNYDRGERTLKETPGIKIPVSCNIGSFEYMCKRISQSGVGGEDGWIYRYFIKGKDGVREAFDNYQRGLAQQKQRLNEKVTEIFGKKNSRFFNTDAWTLQATEADKVEMRSGVSIVTEKDGVAERIELPMSKGAATYLYMVWKMDDGRMKMAKQGFDGQSMQEIEDFIGPRYKQLADWLQDEFLTESRARYNERYVEMYNTSMARIKNYVPLRVNRDATYRQSSLSDDRQRQVTLEQRAGSLINRTVNLTPVDITKSVFDVIGEHVDSMENWYAYSPVRRDLDAILSSTYFRNQLDINNAGHFKRFYDAAAVATQSYMPPAAEHGDKFMALMTRGLLSGNIAWRFATAIKQLYSGTSFFGYTYDPRFAGYLVKNLGTSLIGKNIRWCIENIPSYAYRADMGDVGNYRLQEKIGTGRMESAGQFLKKMGLVKAGEKVDNMRWEQVDRFLRKYTQVGMLPNRFIDLLTCGFGAKTIYDYKYAELKRAIDRNATLTEEGRKNALEDAHRKAVMEADIFYNSTQQSSHPAFLSPMQVGRGALDRAFSAYQNSNLGYVRKMLGHALDLVRSLQFKRMVEAYKRMYVEQGMTESDAQDAARRQTLGLIGTSLLGLYIFGWYNNKVWDIGSRGFFGWGTDPVTDEDKKKDNESDEAYKLRLQWDDMLGYLGGFARPIQGTPLGNILKDLSEMRGYNPLLAFDELNSLATDMTKIMREDGVFSREMLWALTNRALRTGGINMETLGNIYFGVEQMMMDGGGWDEKMIDLMFILNTPNKGRMSAAKNLYKDASLEEYVAAVAKAEKYLKRGESLAQWFPSMKYAEGDKFKREFEKLQKEWNANHVDIASATKQEVDEIIKSADKRSLTDANKLYNQKLNWEDITEDSRISRMADVLATDQQVLNSLKEKLKTAKKKNANNEDRLDSARTIYNNLYEYRVKPMTQIKKKYSTYKERVDKLKFQLDGGENDVPVMETIRQLRTEFLKELDAYEKYEAGAREKYPLKALDDMAD